MRRLTVLLVVLTAGLVASPALSQQDSVKVLTQRQIRDKLIVTYANAYAVWELLAATKEVAKTSFIKDANAIIATSQYVKYADDDYRSALKDLNSISSSLKKDSVTNDWLKRVKEELDGSQRLLQEVTTALDAKMAEISTSYEKAKVDEEEGNPQYLHWALTQMESLIKSLRGMDIQSLNANVATLISRTAPQ